MSQYGLQGGDDRRSYLSTYPEIDGRRTDSFRCGRRHVEGDLLPNGGQVDCDVCITGAAPDLGHNVGYRVILPGSDGGNLAVVDIVAQPTDSTSLQGMTSLSMDSFTTKKKNTCRVLSNKLCDIGSVTFSYDRVFDANLCKRRGRVPCVEGDAEYDTNFEVDIVTAISFEVDNIVVVKTTLGI